jgi:hypothetical protein
MPKLSHYCLEDRGSIQDKTFHFATTSRLTQSGGSSLGDKAAVA